MQITLAVKEIVTFIFQQGHLTNDFLVAKKEMIGTQIHQYWQSLYNPNDVKEYYIKDTFRFFDVDLTLHGFIDGLINENEEIIVEEIKTAFSDIEDEPKNLAHLGQMKIYAFMYMKKNQLSSIKTRLTYVSEETKLGTKFDFSFSYEELYNFFNSVLEEYILWIKKISNHRNSFIKTAQESTFPFEDYRAGQLEFIEKATDTIINEKVLYAVAPTGVGKTISTFFGSLKAIHNNNEKIFYLTAKNSGKKTILDTVEFLRNKGLDIKAIEITAKEKSCSNDEKKCDYHFCPFAFNFYGKLKDALDDIFSNYDLFNFETIKKVALDHQICPFEFSLELSYYADLIIGDYNYAFDPRAHLIRYFDTNNYAHILLVDEAHNLVSRSKDMYSSTFNISEVYDIRGYLGKYQAGLKRSFTQLISLLESYPNEYYYQSDLPNDLVNLIRKCLNYCEDLFLKKDEFVNRDEAIAIYYNLKNFVTTSERFNSVYRFVVDKASISLKCLDASSFILNTLENTQASIFFSATMYPLGYYKKFITASLGEDILIPSPFDPNNLQIIIKRNANTKYTERANSINDILETIEAMVSYKTGNYIVFFPSYEYLNMVAANLQKAPYEYIIQTPKMTEKERNAIISEFCDSSITKVGFFVMGGVFSEGIDYLGDMLSGVMIVSVCLPMIGGYNDMLRKYFDDNGENGFLYAYKIPGMSKVIQSVGRVIRSETDKGIAILYDERFSYPEYKSLMPLMWKNISYVNSGLNIKIKVKSHP